MSNKTRKITQQVHLFKDEEGNLHEWTMENVVDAGTPIDPETGDDLEYVGPKPPENEVGNYFNMEELDSVYVTQQARYVVSLIVGYDHLPVTSAQDAAAAALELTYDGDSAGTLWHVHDRETGQTLKMEQVSFDTRDIYG